MRSRSRHLESQQTIWRRCESLQAALEEMAALSRLTSLTKFEVNGSTGTDGSLQGLSTLTQIRFISETQTFVLTHSKHADVTRWQ